MFYFILPCSIIDVGVLGDVVAVDNTLGVVSGKGKRLRPQLTLHCRRGRLLFPIVCRLSCSLQFV